MKTFFSLLSMSLLFSSQVFALTNIECNKNFGQDVANCAHATEGSKKACVQDAKVAKVACLSGVNACLNTCQNTYNTNVTTCKSTYDPGVCGGLYDCEQIIIPLQADCLNSASTALATCNSSCQL